MGILDFLKKQAPAQAPITPVSSKDEKLGKLDLPPLTPPTSPVRPLPPLPAVPMPSLPSLPPLSQTMKLLPRLDELPKISVDAKPASSVPQGAPPLPTLPPIQPKIEKPAEKLMENFDERIEMPVPKHVEKPVEKPIEKPAEKPKLEPKFDEPEPAAKIQKMLEELSTADFELPPLQALSETRMDPVLAKLRRPGPLFIPMSRFEETLVHAQATAEGFNNLETHNEKLGTIESQTKDAIDGLMAAFDTIQKTLLFVDEKLFKVN